MKANYRTGSGQESARGLSQPVSITELLSNLSDLLFERFVVYAARRYAPLLGTPVHFVEMLFLIEDKRFPLHFGLDPIAIVRAAVFNLRGCGLQGGSTITQQLYWSRQKQTKPCPSSSRIPRKILQCLWALFYSAKTPKLKVLKEYLEMTYWGKSYYGIDSAAAGYFGKSRACLSVAQSFFLAERIAAPNRMCVPRISNLSQRMAILNSLRRHGATSEEIAAVYGQKFGAGSDVFQHLVEMQ